MTHIPGVHNYFTRIDRLNGGERVARLHACTTRIGHVCTKASTVPLLPSSATPIPEPWLPNCIATIKPSHCRGDPPRNGDVVGGEKQPSEVCTCVKCAFVAFENYFCVTKNRNGSEWTEGGGGGARLISIPAFLRGCEGYWCSRCLLWEGKLKIPFSLSHVRRDEILRYRLVRNENSYYKEFRSSMSFFPIPESFLSSRRKLRMFNNISSSPFFISFPSQRGNDRVSREDQ